MPNRASHPHKTGRIGRPQTRSPRGGAAAPQRSFVHDMLVAVVTAGLTLMGTHFQLTLQNERADRIHFIDGAQTTAQETSRLLEAGYNALSKLVEATGEKGWQEFSRTSWNSYQTFHRHWRQQLIEQHFKLARYFGKDMADQLMHVDEIDLHPVAENLASPSPCDMSGVADFDVVKLAFQIECTTRLIAVHQDILEASRSGEDTAAWFDAIEAKRELWKFAHRLVAQYDQASVRYLREMESRLTQLGERRVTVLSRNPNA